MRFLYSTVVWVAIAVITIVTFAFVCVTSLLLWPIDRTRRIAQAGTTTWGHACFRANPLWTLDVRGRERLRAAGTCVLVANHQSHVDVFALSALHGNWRWVSKASLFWVPFMGWGMKALGTPGVRRGDKESGQRMLEHCRWWLDRGVSIFMFPEGTRSADGVLAPFRAGAFKLALESGRPVLPIVVEGSRLALPKDSADVSRRATVVVSVLEPVDPAPYRGANDVEGLSAAVRARIEEELARLRS